MDTAAKPGTLQMIADFSNAKAPSGFEEETIAAARKHIVVNGSAAADKLRSGSCAHHVGFAYLLDGYSYRNGNLSEVHTDKSVSYIHTRVCLYFLESDRVLRILIHCHGKGTACVKLRNDVYYLLPRKKCSAFHDYRSV